MYFQRRNWAWVWRSPKYEWRSYPHCVFWKYELCLLIETLVEEDQEKFSDFWETIVLGVIGETLDDEDNITGIRAIDKSNPYKKQINYRIEVWFKNWNDEQFKNTLKDRIEKIAEACEVSPKDISFSQNDYSKWAAKWKWSGLKMEYIVFFVIS